MSRLCLHRLSVCVRFRFVDNYEEICRTKGKFTGIHRFVSYLTQTTPLTFAV